MSNSWPCEAEGREGRQLIVMYILLCTCSQGKVGAENTEHNKRYRTLRVYREFTVQPLIPEIIAAVVRVQWITFFSHYGRDVIN